MKRTVLFALASFLVIASLQAANLPGFDVKLRAVTADFCNSLAFDSKGTLYYTTTWGGIYRVADGVSTKVAQVDTYFLGNAGLLGMALLNDTTGIVHYTTGRTPSDGEPAWEIISKIDLSSGAETQLAKLPDNAADPGAPVLSEHHGGIPTVGEDGSVWIAIGEFWGYAVSENPDSWGGKIVRIDADGTAHKIASGFRNPYGIAWDRTNKRLIVADNGYQADDELNIVTSSGGFYGWPCTMGNAPPCARRPDAIPPIFTFPEIVVPTGFKAMQGENSYMRHGYLLTTWGMKTLYYIPDIDVRPLPQPVQLLRDPGELPLDTDFPLLDVAVAPNGDVYFTNLLGIYELTFPKRGDCNADGTVSLRDLDALTRELGDGDPQSTFQAQNGSFRGSWGCDANGDGLISATDRGALSVLLGIRNRAVRAR